MRHPFWTVCLLLILIAAPLRAADTKDKELVRVGIFPLEPINYIDDTGVARGLNPDLLKQFARNYDKSLRFVPGSWSEGLERLQNGEIDLMMTVIRTEDRAKVMDYAHEPILEVWGQVFVRPDDHIDSIKYLAGKRVALMRRDMNGGNFKKVAERFGVTCEYIEFANFSEVFAAVAQGRADAGVAPQHFGLRNAGNYGLVPSSIQFSPIPVYFTTKKGQHKELLHQLDYQLQQWKDDKNSIYYESLANWLGVQQVHTTLLPPWLFPSLAFAAAFAFGLLLLSLLLKSRVRKRTAELRESRESYRQLIDTMVQPLALHEILCDTDDKPVDYRFLEVNPAFEKLLGRSAKEIIGERIRSLLPSIEQRWIDTYGKVALTGEPAHFQNYSADLDRHFDVVAYSPREGQFATIITDITDRVQMEEERRRLDEQVQQTQKLESLGVLAGGIAHDFNNILMSVLGHCELALHRVSKESPVVASLQQIKNSARKAADLANQMLAYSGKGKFVVEPHDLSLVVEEMEQMLAVSVSKKVVLRYELRPDLPSVEVDVTQLRQIILNLVINASDAIGERSGIVAISTGVMDCDKNYLSETWLDENLPAGQYVYLEVADTGSGMTPETIKRIFEPFYTTKFSGRGLGMAAVLGIVRGHQGAIKIYTEPDKGSTFKILLPASGKPAVLFDSDENSEPFEGDGKVLLVDDDESIRSICRSMLEELGFEVILADDGRQALEIFAECARDIRFVLMDLTMPHLDGEQAFREMRRINPDAKVILSSGYNEQDVTQKFIGKGLSGFLKKPYPISALRAEISKLYDREKEEAPET